MTISKGIFLTNYTSRSSRPEEFCEKGVLRNFTKITGKHLCQSLFLIKLQALGLRPATLFKKRLWHRCFPVNFAKFLRTSFSQNTSRRLLLVSVYFKGWSSWALENEENKPFEILGLLNVLCTFNLRRVSTGLSVSLLSKAPGYMPGFTKNKLQHVCSCKRC